MRRPALIPLLAALLAALVAAGCGSSGSDDDQAAPIAAQAVIEEFAQVPGMPALERTAATDPSWDQLSLGLDLSAGQQRKYGTFTVYVVDAEDEDAVGSLLADKDTAAPIPADAEGIHWDFDELAGSYVAQKRYGPNVVLAWWNERKEPGTDDRWDRLDQLLQDVASR